MHWLVSIVMGIMESDEFVCVLKIDFFIIVQGYKVVMTCGCSSLLISCLMFDEWIAVWESMGNNLASWFTILLFVSAMCPDTLNAI